MLVILSNSGHYPDEYWDMTPQDARRLGRLLDNQDYYLDAATTNDSDKAQVLRDVLARSERLPAPKIILKYI